ncbi:hypothetical protein GGR50DRAFT_639215 [Xylaria sp. CBS 124048]|nr:hypothetical protein GGR50DRAFT_639215 [Xylaria sp. CBS 124048]
MRKKIAPTGARREAVLHILQWFLACYAQIIGGKQGRRMTTRHGARFTRWPGWNNEGDSPYGKIKPISQSVPVFSQCSSVSNYLSLYIGGYLVRSLVIVCNSVKLVDVSYSKISEKVKNEWDEHGHPFFFFFFFFRSLRDS